MKTLRSVIMGLLLFVLWLGQALPAGAEGVIIPILPPQPPHPPRLPAPPPRALAITYHRVTVTIDDQVATTHVDQVFLNESPYEMEGEYLFPLPEGASISRFAMWVDGRPLEAQILDRDEARRIYEEIVRERRDPALLEYVDRGAFRARIYPIPAWGEQRVEIEYSEVLPADAGLVRYVYPLSTDKFSSRPLDEASVTVHITAKQEIRALYSPSHPISEQRVSDREAEVVYRETRVVPSKDFVLYYSVGDGEPSANLITYRDVGEDGFFLLLLTPGQQAGPQEVVPRDVIFVLDISGSMRGKKLDQAKAAARYVLDNLNPGDRFNVIAFSTATRAFARELRPRDEARQAASFINGLSAGGGTNIGRALEEALAMTAPGRQGVILFLTDGLPTEGEIRTGKLIEQIAEDAGDNVRIFCFGVGYDVNTILLDVVAQDNNGTSAYVLPDEDIERVVSSLYEQISQPVLTDLALDFGFATESGVVVEEIYPYPLPDLGNRQSRFLEPSRRLGHFAGGQLVVVGRYRMRGDADATTTVTLSGRTNDRKATYRYPGMRFVGEGGADFIPRLWATRKIGYLLTQIRLHGAQRELVDEIVELSVRYGIVTPYTSFLIDETEDALSSEGRDAIVGREMLLVPGTPSAALGLGGAGGPASGEAAVQSSIAQEAMRKADAVAEPQSERVKTVGPKAFVLRDGVWVDTTYDAATMTPQRVAFASARHFELLRAHPEWGRYLAIGERVILVWEGRAYAFGETGEQAPRGEPTATALPVPGPSATPAAPTVRDARSLLDWWRDITRR